MYSEGFGCFFHQSASTISCRDLIRYYPYATEKSCMSHRLPLTIVPVNHGRQGKWMGWKGRDLKIKKCEGVLGQAYKRPRGEMSPQTER